jgi:hypothetical protein
MAVQGGIMVDTNRHVDQQVEQEFSPDQGSIKDKTTSERDRAKADRDELEFAENVDQPAEALARQRQSPHGAGISNRPLSDEEAEQHALPERNTRKTPER